MLNSKHNTDTEIQIHLFDRIIEIFNKIENKSNNFSIITLMYLQI